MRISFSTEQKVAILLLELGPYISRGIVEFLSDEEMNKISMAIETMEPVPTNYSVHILTEFLDTLSQNPHSPPHQILREVAEYA